MLHTKFQLNRLNGSGEEVENVKSLTDTKMLEAGRMQDARTDAERRTKRYNITSLGPIGPGELTSYNNLCPCKASHEPDLYIRHFVYTMMETCK